MFNAELHQRPWVAARSTMPYTKTFDPPFVFIMRDDGCRVALCNETLAQGYVGPRKCTLV